MREKREGGWLLPSCIAIAPAPVRLLGTATQTWPRGPATAPHWCVDGIASPAMDFTIAHLVSGCQCKSLSLSIVTAYLSVPLSTESEAAQPSTKSTAVSEPLQDLPPAALIVTNEVPFPLQVQTMSGSAPGQLPGQSPPLQRQSQVAAALQALPWYPGRKPLMPHGPGCRREAPLRAKALR